MLYGNAPKDLGRIDLNPTEMLFWMYCPVKVPGSYTLHVPDNLKQFNRIIEEACADFDPFRTPKYLKKHYIYVTAKTLWISGDYIGNRPGWHSDGFGTDDINYIWYDRAPTEFLILDYLQSLPKDCTDSMAEMKEWADYPFMYRSGRRTYENKHLLRLDPSVIHRCPVGFEPGMRTFVKISISKNPYNLEGNSINHLLPNAVGPLVPRSPERNHPSKAF